jgi:hypothetical protein
MSTVLVITPIVIANWPVIATAITAAMASMGFATLDQGMQDVRRSRLDTTQKAEIEVDNSEILAGTEGQDETLVVEKDGIRATFSRDARGALRICMEGRGLTKQQLKELGETLVGRVTQQYVYHRIVTELKERNMKVVDEEVTKDQVVRIKVRNW